MSLAGLLFHNVPVQGASPASDNAGNAAYNDGWQTGDNGGTGFGAWTLQNSSAGFFVGDPRNNGGNNQGNIGNPSFGLYSGSGGLASATRSFTGGGLAIGQTFLAKFDNGYLDNNSAVGIQLFTGATFNEGSQRFQYLFLGGQGNYRVDGATEQRTNVGFTDGGMSLSLTRTDTDTFSFTVTFNGGGIESFTGQLGGVQGSDIDSIRVFSSNVGYGGQNDFFVNDFEVVPEPSTVIAGGLVSVVLGLSVFRRVRRRGMVPA